MLASEVASPHDRAAITPFDSTAHEDSASSPRRTIAVTNPSTLEHVGDVPVLDAAEVRAAIGRARAAQAAWAARSVRDRLRWIERVHRSFVAAADRIVETTCRETGKSRVETLAQDVLAVCDLLGYYEHSAARTLAPRRLGTGVLVSKRARRLYQPHGVVGVIAPWNSPVNLAAGPAITALLAGNAVVIKPSELTPFSGLLVGELLRNALPDPELVQIVTGDGATGEALVRGGVDKLVFTGSVATGKRVMAAAAETLTPLVLELGGKDPMIVSADADLDRAAAAAVWGAFTNCGQACVSIERVYVDAAVHDAFVEKVLAETRRVNQGPYGNDGVHIGSMSFQRQVEIVLEHIADALAKGARVRAGGARRSDLEGLFVPPTVVTDVASGMKILEDETFGPLLPIVKVADDEEAVRLANLGRFGLSASVWSKDLAKARRIAERLEVGSVVINDCLLAFGIPNLPFGGVKESGFGRSHGEEGLIEMSRVKTVVEDRFGFKREFFWFPYHPRTYDIIKIALKAIFGPPRRLARSARTQPPPARS
ncbi:MAG: aldehyde dehydrogenase family protein [bacterium]